jgi:hypothetical protein
MSTSRIKLEDIEKSEGTTDKEVIDNMTEADINRGILSDKDTPNLSDEELKELKRVPKEGEHGKN